MHVLLVGITLHTAGISPGLLSRADLNYVVDGLEVSVVQESLQIGSRKSICFIGVVFELDVGGESHLAGERSEDLSIIELREVLIGCNSSAVGKRLINVRKN